jgi:hypothetical protein
VTDRSPTKPPLALPAHSHKQYVDGYRDDGGEVDPEDDEQLGYPYHRRGVAAARLGRQDNKPVSVRTSRGHPVELPVEETSPPSSTSSDKPPVARQASRSCEEDAEPNRAGSMLLQLIACGSATAGSAKCGGGRAEPRRSCGLVSRLSSRAGAEDDDEEVVDIAGGELSRRLGQMRVDQKEYFSGSIVESGGRGTPLPASSLKRSNSYNEER